MAVVVVVEVAVVAAAAVVAVAAVAAAAAAERLRWALTICPRNPWRRRTMGTRCAGAPP